MILGVGIDILAIRRIERLLQRYPDRFAQRILTHDEIDEWEKRGRRSSSFAKVFSIKEAVAKAVSKTEGASWHDIETSHDVTGRPTASLSGTLLKNLGAGNHRVFVSVSDEKEYVVAYAIIEVIDWGQNKSISKNIWPENIAL
ncbi:MAG: holo-ACP synthase [Holosporales bacterium]|jgi:holo-[acyl-carrier protein] synthase|nr:holo-ACP synthase [Holosporales bacterium]